MIEYWYRALRGDGIVIETTDPERLRAALYRARPDDPDVKQLSVRIISSSEVVICRASHLKNSSK